MWRGRENGSGDGERAGRDGRETGEWEEEEYEKGMKTGRNRWRKKWGKNCSGTREQENKGRKKGLAGNREQR